MCALSTCGEPDKIKKNTHPKYTTALFRIRDQAVLISRGFSLEKAMDEGTMLVYVPL